MAKFQYVPMMTAETPMSLSLLDRAEVVAKMILDCAVLATRAKAVRYSGDTSWHTDSVIPISSVGFAAYLEPLGTDNGALRVLPGSHRPEFS
ncbi:MAG: hypothetical protein DMF61_11655 [Blastocatellia bacterium AA13]|nr:MAG: hypothetical protein DMF61_11655 [Blastocatellia bacterium AA13]